MFNCRTLSFSVSKNNSAAIQHGIVPNAKQIRFEQEQLLNNQLISKDPGPALGYLLVFSAVTSKGVMGLMVILSSINLSLNTPSAQSSF